jgi:nucleoid-associated protein YgaU
VSPLNGTSFADFDANYAAINTSASAEAGAGSLYNVRSGDSLQGIAQSVWGDASLWYMLAEANGLTAASRG